MNEEKRICNEKSLKLLSDSHLVLSFLWYQRVSNTQFSKGPTGAGGQPIQTIIVLHHEMYYLLSQVESQDNWDNAKGISLTGSIRSEKTYKMCSKFDLLAVIHFMLIIWYIFN